MLILVRLLTQSPCYAFYQFLRLLVWKPDFGGNLSKNLSQVDISAIFKLSAKLSLSILHFLKLSVILRNYRQHYRIENLRKIIEKLSSSKKIHLSPTPSHSWFWDLTKKWNIVKVAKIVVMLGRQGWFWPECVNFLYFFGWSSKLVV